MYTIGIDIGTTNVKACLFKVPSFELITVQKFPTPTKYDEYGSEFLMDVIWSNLKKAIKKLGTAIEDMHLIKTISISSAAQSIVLYDSLETTLKPTITWYDPRSQQEAKIINKHLGSKYIYETTGIVSHSNHSLTKLMWLKNHKFNSFSQMKKWTCLSGFVAFKLTGEYATDESLASRTLLMNISNKSWSNDILSTYDLDINIFPKIVESGEAIAHLKPEISKKLGLSKETTVAIGGHDHMAGSVCTNLKSTGEMLNSTGTTEGLLLLNSKPILGDLAQNNALSNGVYVNENLFTIYSSLPTAGYSIDWFINTFLTNLDDFEKHTSKLHDIYIDNPNHLLEKLILYIPHLRGSGPPDRDFNAKALYYGLRDSTTKKDLLFSTLVGLCLELRVLNDIYDNLKTEPTKCIKVIGPAVKNPLWLQLKADILNIDIEAYKIDEAVAKGAAIVANLKQNFIKEVPEESFEVYKPNKKNHANFSRYYNELYLPFLNTKKKFDSFTII
ncbi:FGGY-family carbohydrate kinase [Staphylococcus pseudoxylosus]|uniref:Carbohydrate kinase n=1 Tax=Staphylococcus pseudoxylosus TaxID=2282419 RepID=A0AAQ0S5G8_9STAP|nr:FGGY family carbohydrate kinase [Staphylococcus pseudoxylosus]MCE5003668.1 hypothetical protein [Staphylococcus pseudoxylosus]RMI83879.1 hypothetical protein D9V42_13970 [Staphylococcus pseudoxylosus]